MGPLGFAMALQPVIERIKREVPDLLLNAWYLDDGTLCGTLDDLQSALAIIEEDGPPRGLFLNRRKSLLYIPGDAPLRDNPLPLEVPVSKEGFVLLSSPIDTSSFCNSLVHHRVAKLKSILSLLPNLEDSQAENSLLRWCLAFPKINFALRTCPPGFIREPIAEIDSAIFDSLSHHVGGSLFL